MTLFIKTNDDTYRYYGEKRKPECHRCRSGILAITIYITTNILVFAEKDVKRTNGITYRRGIAVTANVRDVLG